MRFTALASIDVVSLIVSTVIAIVMAKLGYGYWALVAMTVSSLPHRDSRYVAGHQLGSGVTAPAGSEFDP